MADPGAAGGRGVDRVDPAVLAQTVAARVREHPAVAALHGGQFGTVASYLPGRRVVGVHIDEETGAVELAVVLRLDAPLPRVVTELRKLVIAQLGAVPVNITVADVVSGDEPPAADPSP